VLWDLDGTLADSRDYHWRAWREVLAADGVSITHQQFLASFGQRNDAILARWIGSAAPGRIRRIGDEKEARFRDLVTSDGLVPLPGAAEWVARLAAAGWRQAVASSAPRANVQAMLDALGLRKTLGVFVAAEDVGAGKPDPEVFLAAAGRLAVAPPACVVVEDAAAGIEAARRARMRSVGLGVPADVTVGALTDLAESAFEDLLERGAP